MGPALDPQYQDRLPGISILISPPEAKSFDSFIESIDLAMVGGADSQTDSIMSDNTLPPIRSNQSRSREALPSPPISPWGASTRKSEGRPVSSQSNAPRDPPLFSQTDSETAIPLDEPLFPPTEVIDPKLDAIVENHIANSSINFLSTSARRPTKQEYLLALVCRSDVLQRYNKDPHAWYREESRILQERYPGMRRVRNNKLVAIAPAPPNGVKKISTPRSRNVRSPRATPRSKVYDSFTSVKTPARQAGPRIIGASREDTDFDALPDYCPPLSTLPNNSNALKADWRGQMLDLSNDPHRHLLHEAEVKLAATLRLSCATYLCSKRRIFQARLDALRIGKEFRKTDSQQACKIDVNKASKLWTAYEKVGWFRAEYFRQHIV